jgi:hypothetical protein
MFLCFYAVRVFLSPEAFHYFEKILPCIKAVKESTEVVHQYADMPLVSSSRGAGVYNSFDRILTFGKLIKNLMI